MSKTIFYSDYSALSIAVSVIKKTIQFAIAPTNDGQKKQGRPTPGEKIYAWDESKCGFFSLRDVECAQLFHYWDAVSEGKYTNPKEQDPNRAKAFAVSHFLNQKPSRLLLIPKSHPTIQMSIVNPNKQMVSYVLRPYEVLVVKAFLEHGFKNLPFYSAFLDGIDAKKKYDSYNNKDGNGQQSSQRYSGGDPYYENYGGEQQQPQQRTPSQQPSDRNQQSGELPPLDFDGNLPPLDHDFGTPSSPKSQAEPDALSKMDELPFRF